MADILAIAKGEKGTTEGAGRSSKYGRWLDAQPPKTSDYATADWCGAFQLWCIAQGGPEWTAAAGGLNKGFAYVQNWYDWMRANGRTSKTPKARRLVWYDWAGTPPGANHIGLIDHFSSTHIWAWEGNRNSRVELVERPRDGQILGYGEWWDYVPAPADDTALVVSLGSA